MGSGQYQQTKKAIFTEQSNVALIQIDQTKFANYFPDGKNIFTKFANYFPGEKKYFQLKKRKPIA